MGHNIKGLVQFLSKLLSKQEIFALKGVKVHFKFLVITRDFTHFFIVW